MESKLQNQEGVPYSSPSPASMSGPEEPVSRQSPPRRSGCRCRTPCHDLLNRRHRYRRKHRLHRRTRARQGRQQPPLIMPKEGDGSFRAGSRLSR